MPNSSTLSTWCLFCDPGKHGQLDQVALRSDNFYVFAGLGAIVEGYLIIAPYECQAPGREYHSIASLPRDLLDEVRFLREIVAAYYRDRHGTAGISFEHGRAGACLIDVGDTLHCYHPHLCCYPTDIRLAEHVSRVRPEPIDGLYSLASRAGSAPYLYMEHCTVRKDLPVDSASRESWTGQVAVLSDEVELESQYLRRVLADAMGCGDLWDWRVHPTFDAARRVVAGFHEWLAGARHLAFVPERLGPRIDFLRSVIVHNGAGNDVIADRYLATWGQGIQADAVARFVARLPTSAGKPRILDLACGPAIYAKPFHHLGLRYVGADLSARMLGAAQRHLTSELGDADPPALIQMDACQAAFRPGSFDGVWFSAGLVHLPRLAARRTLQGIRDLLADDGICYVSAQVGQGFRVRHEGRVFVYFTESELRELFEACGLAMVESWGGTTDRGTLGDTRTKVWTHALLVRAAVPTSAPESDARALSALGERALLERIRGRLLAEDAPSLPIGIGDDAAAVSAEPGAIVVATVDPCPEPVVCLIKGADPWVTGWYSMTINLSDLAAMGATPIGALLAIEAPMDYPVADLDRFYDGAIEAARAYQCPIIGGNIKDANRFSCVGVALGEVRPERMLRRDAARPGESILVLGPMGVFWAGVLQAMHAFRVDGPELSLLLDALRRPVPRVREGMVLAERNWSRCAMDSSDGITACLYEIAASSGVDMHIDLTGLAPDPVVAKVADAAGIDVRKLLLAWGDWQLVCTAPPGLTPEITAAMAGLGCEVKEIGWVSDGPGLVWLHEPDRTSELNYLASERFSAVSYFTYGIERYARALRETPLIRPGSG